MRVVLVTYGSRGDVEPMTGLAVRLQALGAEVRVCAPPDFAELLDDAGVPLTPVGWPIRALATGAIPGKAKVTLSDIAAELTAMAYEAVAGAAEGCDAVVATGSFPAVAGTRAAAERLGVPYVFTTFSPCYLPSPHHPPVRRPGQVIPPEVTGNRALWDLHAENMEDMFGETINVHRASIGLPPVSGVRDYVFTGRPFLAADPVLGPWRETPELDVTQTGAWIRPDERPLPAGLEAFLAAGAEPVYVGFGSMPMRGASAQEVSRAVIEAVRAWGRRVLLGSGWADLALIDGRDDCFLVGEVNQQALFRRVAAVVHHGGAGTTTAAARAGAPQVIVPQVADQPYWAGRVTELGIGTGHDGPTPTAESLSAALAIALAPETGARAAAVAETVRTDGADLAAKLLLDLIGRGGPAVSEG
ncbi:glycosyltransferase family 1 protein [Microbispora sp. RL4-1S]|uniref:Glycosyltransferase family 1 protein n=1 Tax=Microbispora oryzae TaxID=2806554 RepID=A0A940WJ53_9ACTN|nr:glycosyltransferase [Microbispora oryzae]MBP2704212.1 glycosyltransferase family 1 protein [Microbispora oryzae]